MEWDARKYENKQYLIMLDYLEKYPDSQIKIIPIQRKTYYGKVGDFNIYEYKNFRWSAFYELASDLGISASKLKEKIFDDIKIEDMIDERLVYLEKERKKRENNLFIKPSSQKGTTGEKYFIPNNKPQFSVYERGITFNFIYTDSESIFDSVVIEVPLIGISFATHEERIKTVKQHIKEIDNVILSKLQQEKKFIDCNISTSFLKTDRKTLTHDCTIIYYMSWKEIK